MTDDRDVEVTTLRGEPDYRTRQALDRLAATLSGDWVIIISSPETHLIARPADTVTGGTPPQRPSEAPQRDEPAPAALPDVPTAQTGAQRRIRLGRFVPGYGYRVEIP